MAQVITNLTPNVREALFDFIANFATPPVDENSILFGNQNNLALPETNDYIVFSLLNSIRHGTGVEQYEQDSDEQLITLLEQVEIPVQIDCYADTASGSDGMNAYFRAQAIETVARSSVGVAFLAQYGISCLYADDPSDTTIVGDSDNYVRRWTVTLHLSLKAGLKVPMSFFSDINLDKVQNADAIARQ